MAGRLGHCTDNEKLWVRIRTWGSNLCFLFLPPPPAPSPHILQDIVGLLSSLSGETGEKTTKVPCSGYSGSCMLRILRQLEN